MSDEEKIKEWNRKNDPLSPDNLLHKGKLEELSTHCKAIVKLVDEYFQPPSIMAWRGDGDWSVFIRRKGSNEEFGEDEWQS